MSIGTKRVTWVPTYITSCSKVCKSSSNMLRRDEGRAQGNKWQAPATHRCQKSKAHKRAAEHSHSEGCTVVCAVVMSYHTGKCYGCNRRAGQPARSKNILYFLTKT